MRSTSQGDEDFGEFFREQVFPKLGMRLPEGDTRRVLNAPANMKILKLPDLEEFRSFQTVGPSGQRRLDINGQAAALECYLQLDDNACIRWSSYNANLNTYQGALINKEHYKNGFLSQ